MYCERPLPAIGESLYLYTTITRSDSSTAIKTIIQPATEITQLNKDIITEVQKEIDQTFSALDFEDNETPLLTARQTPQQQLVVFISLHPETDAHDEQDIAEHLSDSIRDAEATLSETASNVEDFNDTLTQK